MRRFSPISSLAVALLALVVGAQALNVSVRRMREPEGGVFTAARLEANGEFFSVVVPHGWRTAFGAQPDTLTLSTPTGEMPILIAFSTQSAKPVVASAEALRLAVVPYLKDAVVLENFPAYSGYGPGQGLELSFALQGRSMKARAVVIPLEQGYASLVLTCAAEEYARLLPVFGTTLTSFRRAPEAGTEVAVPIVESAATEPPRARAQLAEPVQAVEVLQTEPVAPPPVAPPEPRTIFDGREDYLLFGGVGLLLGLLASWTLARHKREAEIRALSGGYLSDGTEVASFKMPEWFAPAPIPVAPANAEVGVVVTGLEEPAPAPVGKSPVEIFLEQAPELLGHIRQTLRALGRSGNEAEWQAALADLPQHVAALKERANFWEMRPAWQMSSALELLARRIADKPKDATPSTLRTISTAADLLQKLCAPGIRPNLIIDPPIKVLAVDDDALCLRALSFALQKASLVPDLAENGVKALALATERPYDVIFMDIQMPEMDGLTACQRIHETEANAATPVVFVTIQSDFHTRAQSTVIGGSDLMAKPFLVFELAVKALTAAMRKRLQLQHSASTVSPTGAVQGHVAPEAIRVAIASGLAEARRPEPAAEAEAAPGTENVEKTTGTGNEFLDGARDYLLAMRKVLEDAGFAPTPTERQERLGDLYLRVHSFATQAGMAGLPLAARVASAVEALLKKLYEKPAQATASTLNTIATALDLLEDLRVPGRRQKLADDSPVHLLVVDDEPLARRAITGALQLAFEKPDSAEDGASALALAVQKTYDVIFTDVQMPGLDGFALCSELHATAANRTTPVVFITGQDDGDAREKARRSGGCDFIAKPCLPSEITLKALIFVIRKRFCVTPVEATPRPPAPTPPPSRPRPSRLKHVRETKERRSSSLAAARS